jgi:leucyl aminopeptidase
MMVSQNKLIFLLEKGTKIAEATRKTMRFYSTSRSGGSLAVALASARLFPSNNNLSSNLMVTAFSSSFYLQQAHSLTEGRGYSSSSALSMSKMNQSFETHSFDKPCGTMAWSPLSVADLAASGSELDASWSDDADLVFLGVFAPAKDESETEEEDNDEEEEAVDPTLVGATKDLDESLGGALSELMVENFKAFKNGAEAGATLPTLRTYVDGKTKRYIVVGLGSEPKESEPLGSIGSAIGKALATKCDAEKKVAHAKFLLPESIASDAKNLKDMASTFYSTLYADNRHRTGKKVVTPAEDLKSLTLVADDPTSSEIMEDALDAGRKIATGIAMTKDIVNAPHNVLNSESLADTAKRLAEESGGSLTCKVLGKEECEERGMGAYLGVARGSETEPQFIHITYTPTEGDVKKKVGVVGKGLLFDTGGYNIKTQMMELMKFDCGGAAAVLGAARAVGALKPPGVECHFVVAACENMINERAIVPSDILTASNGKTIEVLNTDAEGRLTLADALVYCDKELDCESIIELSTLTGACMVALGQVRKNLFVLHTFAFIVCLYFNMHF